MTQRISLTRYLIEKQRGSQDAGGQGTIPPQLRLLLEVVARACKSISLAELADETFILSRRPTGPGLYDAIISACRAAGFSPRVGQEAPRMMSTLSLVAAGLGVSI
eukprot:gene26193-26374_t